ncbi:dienelactone hydrolase family protein [Altererythrobacter aquiaggeris]|uniref:dienelactone hydrolase family protein n=1 Tax=Aestuarierythrobacter aquiaggeris TaxID=1898396 RepID=UPI003019ED6C
MDLAEMKRRTDGWRALSRRQFGVIGAAGAAATLAACAGVDGNMGNNSARALTETAVTITTADGTMDAVFIAPASGKHPAVICWPDIASLRDSFLMMGRRTAADGYAVLVVNPYYRDSKAPQFADFATFMQGGWDKVGPWRKKLTTQAIMSDTRAIVSWLDAQRAVDTSRGIAAEGYCMGGPFTVWSTAAVAGRVKAAASFHGGGLVTDEDMSPHKVLGGTSASYLIAVAQNDDVKDPQNKVRFAEAAAAAGRPAKVDVYAGDHGWTVLDSPSYAQAAAEKAYADKLALYAGL